MSDDDAYARKFMGGETLRYLDKVNIPKWMHTLLVGSGVGAVVATLAAGVPLAALLVGGITFLTWATMTTIRVAVSDRHVHIQYGLWGPKIVLADIIDVEDIEYKAMRWGGWGIKWNLAGERAYSVPGRGGRAVKIRYREGGKERVVVVSSEHPLALKTAIDEARGAIASAALDDVQTHEEQALVEQVELKR